MSSSDAPTTTDEMDEAGEPESQEQPPQQPPEWDRLALFVDCARVWADDVEDALEDIIARAERVEGRVYHNWELRGSPDDDSPSRADRNTESWAEFCDDYELDRVDAPQISATGIQLTLDAIDLRQEVDALCILSVSHQLGPLCQRFRDAGVYVVGLSNWRSKNEFRGACDEFEQIDDRLMSQARQQAERHRDEDSAWAVRIQDLCHSLRSGGNAWAPLPLLETYVQEIYPEFDTQDDDCDTLEEWIQARREQFSLREWRDRRSGEQSWQVRAAAQRSQSPQRDRQDGRSAPARSPAPLLRRPAEPSRDWEDLVQQAIADEPQEESGWVQMTKLGARLKLIDPDWSPRRYKADKLLTLLDRREDLFEVEEEMHDDEVRVRRHWVRALVEYDRSASPAPAERRDARSPAPEPESLGSRPASQPSRGWVELAAEALRQEPGDEEGWVQIAQLEQRLRQSDPDWSPAHEGAEDLLDLLDQREDLFEVEEEADDDDNILQHWVRLAPAGDA